MDFNSLHLKVFVKKKKDYLTSQYIVSTIMIMLTQKLYRNGNSLAVTIPKQYLKELNMRDGSQVIVEMRGKELVFRKKGVKKIFSSVTPQFVEVMSRVNKQYGAALRELAKK